MKLSELLSEAPSKVSEETKRVREIINSWRAWIKANPQYAEGTFGHYELTPNNELIHKGRAIIVRPYMLDENGELPVKIHSCYKLVIGTTELKSFKNFPDKILYDYRETRKSRWYGSWSLSFGGVYSNDNNFNHITSLNGITPEIQGGLDCSMLRKVNFSHVNTYIKHCELVALPHDYVGPLLSFLKIPSLRRINGPRVDVKSDQEKAYAIVTKYLEGNRNILECQEELIDNDLKDYAEL